MKIVDWPKTPCVFVRRVTENNLYLVEDQVAENMEWVFEPGVRAVDKLHGTNLCIEITDGQLTGIANRNNLVMDKPFLYPNMDFLQTVALKGILKALEKGWLKNLKDGLHYGELVGPKINGNLHNLTEYYFVPFDVLKSKFHWKSWIGNHYAKDFYAIDLWFRNIPSLFTKTYGERGCNLAEGVVFWHPDGRVAKLRRDMFPWYHLNKK